MAVAIQDTIYASTFWALPFIFMTAVMTWLGLHWARFLARKYQLYDVPGERSLHLSAVPRIGGLACFPVILAVSAISFYILPYFASFDTDLWPQFGIFLIGGGLMFLVGFIDDVRSVNCLLRLVLQIVTAFLVVHQGIKFNVGEEPSKIVHYLLGTFSVFWIVGIINLMNWIDGSDGLLLAIGSSVLIATIVILGLCGLDTTSSVFFVCLMMIVNIGVLFYYNFPPARIYMGDSGSNFLGFSLACCTMVVCNEIVSLPGRMNEDAVSQVTISSTLTGLAVAMILMAIPLLDGSYVVLRRLFQGQSPFMADSNHFHHILLKSGVSKKNVLFFYMLNTASLSCLAVALVVRITTSTGTFALLLGASLVFFGVGQCIFLRFRVISHLILGLIGRSVWTVKKQIYDKYFLINKIESEANRSKRSGKEFSLVLLTRRVRKSVSDSHGGDKKPREIFEQGEIFGNQELINRIAFLSRSYDILSRVNKKLVILLPDTDYSGARKYIRRVFELKSVDDPLIYHVVTYPHDATDPELLLSKGILELDTMVREGKRHMAAPISDPLRSGLTPSSD